MLSTVSMPMSFKVPLPLAKRLDVLAKKTGRPKSHYITEAVTEYLADLEDFYLAEKAWADHKAGKNEALPLEKIMREYGLEPQQNRHS